MIVDTNSAAAGLAALPDGTAQYELARELYPICRSITGDGVRQTLRRLSDFVPLTVHEVPSGTQVLDWTVPLEWNIRDAYIARTWGERVVDFRDCNLHVVNYSRPVARRISRAELDRHLHSLPDKPDWIPYRTAYYADTWGFCLADRARGELRDAEYDVVVDSTLTEGSLTFGEILIQGKSDQEVLLSAHVCHPSLANDNLSGLVTLTAVAQYLLRSQRRYTYRILFAPGTIGALAWLALHDSIVHRIRHGLVVSCVGDCGAFTYKQSRRGNAEIDRVAQHVLGHGGSSSIRAFSPDGYDERQYCSPGYNLPVGRLTRTPNGEFPEYHTSADNLHLITPESLAESTSTIRDILDVLECNETLVNTNPKGEPQLGSRGLYRALGGLTDTVDLEQGIRWVLNFSDGHHSLLDIAERSGMKFATIRAAADTLVAHNLLLK